MEQAYALETSSEPTPSGPPPTGSHGRVPSYDVPPADVSHAEHNTAELFTSFYEAKRSLDVDATMAYFSPHLLNYTDATLGGGAEGFVALKDLFTQYMPNWTQGQSYPIRILGGPTSALVAFTDTPELFGGEMHLFGVVDLRDGKIVRWVDYWDSAAFDADLFTALRAPDGQFPTTYAEDQIVDNADPRLSEVALLLHSALSDGDGLRVGELLTYDAVLEDMALRTLLTGRAAITRFLGRAADRLPYGRGSRLRHIVGGARGGGFEWTASASNGGAVGVAAIELNTDGLIDRFTAYYDGRQLEGSRLRDLAAATLEQT